MVFIIGFHSTPTPKCIFTSKKICIPVVFCFIFFFLSMKQSGMEGHSRSKTPAFPWDPFILPLRNTMTIYLIGPRILGRGLGYNSKEHTSGICAAVWFLRMHSSRGGNSSASGKKGKGIKFSGSITELSTGLYYLSLSLSIQATTLRDLCYYPDFIGEETDAQRGEWFAEGHTVRGRWEFHLRTLCLRARCSLC